MIVKLFSFLCITYCFTSEFVVAAAAQKPPKTYIDTYLKEFQSDPNGLNKKGLTPLVNAIVEGDFNKCQDLIFRQADPNKMARGESPLYWAIKIKRKDIFLCLLNAKADPNGSCMKVFRGDQPPLLSLAISGIGSEKDDYGAAKALIQNGADKYAFIAGDRKHNVRYYAGSNDRKGVLKALDE